MLWDTHACMHAWGGTHHFRPLAHSQQHFKFGIMDHHDMWFSTLVTHFSSLPLLEVCQEPPIPQVHTWRTLKVPDWILGGWGHSWHHGSSLYVILDLCAKYQHYSMNRSLSRIPHPRSHTWRTFNFPDWIIGKWGHSWHHGLLWYGILDLFAKFKLSSMNKSVTRTPLEDVEGSWLDTWWMGSFLTSWKIMICDSGLVC